MILYDSHLERWDNLPHQIPNQQIWAPKGLSANEEGSHFETNASTQFASISRDVPGTVTLHNTVLRFIPLYWLVIGPEYNRPFCQGILSLQH